MVPMNEHKRRAKAWKLEEPHQTVSFYLPKQLIRAIKEFADGCGVSYSQVIIDAATLFLAVNTHNTIVIPREAGEVTTKGGA